MNILCNAIDAIEESVVSEQTPDTGQRIRDKKPMIMIHTEVVERDRVTIRIADNGPGIKAEVQPKIFDPFFSTKPVGSGTGLGLSISYQIVVDKHGGKLRFHSVAGQGTKFAIELPIVQTKIPLALESRKVSTL